MTALLKLARMQTMFVFCLAFCLTALVSVSTDARAETAASADTKLVADASNPKAKRKAKKAAAQLSKELGKEENTALRNAVMRAKTRGELVAALREHGGNSRVVQSLLNSPDLGTASMDDSIGPIGSDLTIDPRDLGCLNCLDVHCPTS